MTASSNYPANARYARQMADREGLVFEDLDDGAGYLFRISKGRRSFLSGAGNIGAYPLNSSTAHSIARDKAHTKRVLRAAGIAVIEGGLFFLQDRFAAVQPIGHARNDAKRYAETIGYPVFCKPNRGARGDFAELIHSAADLEDYLDRAARYYDAVLVEPVVTGDEYRVLVIDGRTIFQVKKAAPRLVGDGVRSVVQLLASLNEKLVGYGLSEHRESVIHGWRAGDVPAEGQIIELAGRRNLSGSGGIEELKLSVEPLLADLAVRTARALGLRLAAVDIFDVSTAAVPAQHLVIEANSNPSLTTLEREGHLDVVLDVWAAMARELLG